MKRSTMRAWIFLLAVLVWAAGAGRVLAQDGAILYNKFDAQSFAYLWQIFPDGSGDMNIDLGGEVSGPVWSWDGQLVAISARTTPGAFSRNVYVYDPQSGDLQPVTNFRDFVPDPQHSNWVLAYFKAFSPQGDRIAVSAWFHAQSTMGSSTAPFLQIYSLDGTLLTQVAIAQNISLHQGDGVDWSPGRRAGRRGTG